ncbi:MAG TPA: serine hydrolase domain-containing protein [Pyrinomonadaceae bacterium]|jgi:CubicO group peptidase (beta-lactamase class C family)|nr:serine hydrolase domain-containing protein [Pyrinomonadaceae bacterium]
MITDISRRSFLASTAKTTVAVTLLRSVPGAFAQAAAVQPLFAKLDEFIVRHMRETGAPGLTLALANRNGLIRVSTYGYADTKAGSKVAPETMFEIGSISKSFVGLLLLQLRDEGKLDLNKPIAEYLPWIKINSKFQAITTHHILSHTGGLPGAPLLLDALLGELWTAYEPGKRFLYSNTGYNILGFLIETIDKRPFAESMRTRMLVPLGMTASSPIITNDLRKLMAIGYEPLNEGKPFPLNGPLAEAQWLEVDIAAGSIASTPADMAKYMRMLLNRGALPKGRLLSEESFALFTKSAINSPYRGEPASYGYGIWVSDIEGHTRLRHTGGMVAFSSSIDVDLTGNIGAFASVNANLRGYRPVAVTKYAIELFNASAAGKPLPEPPAPPPASDEVKNAIDYAGTFTSPDGKKLELAAEGNKLILVHANRRIVLERVGSGDRFLVKHPDFDTYLLGFVRDNQQVTQAVYGPDWYLSEKYTGSKTFEVKKEWDAFVGHYNNDSAWYGDTRVVMRKGQLFIDGVQPLVPRGDGKFGIGDPEAPDWVSFESVVDGRAMRLNYSGIIFRRVFTP